MRLIPLWFLILFAPMAWAESEDPFAAIDALLEDNFTTIDQALEAQYQALDQALEDAYERLGKEVETKWGAGEVLLPTKTAWVDYSDDLKTRRVIDFEAGIVTVERLYTSDEKFDAIVRDLNTASTALKTDSVANLAARDHALKYTRETLAKEGIELPDPTTTSNDPVLGDVSGINDEGSVTALLNAVLSQPLTAKSPALKDNQPKLQAIVSPLLNNNKKVSMQFSFVRANNYIAEITSEAEKQSLPPSLLLAIMETESAFNPRARSAVPAFGLMQLVPRSGAMDAYEYVYGKKLLVGPEYLYQADKNVELGAAYLSILHNRYLRHIEDPISRQYCAIAAYNTGATNVARSFAGSSDVREAAVLVNAMTSEAVYLHLQKNLPYEETRRYVEKVRKAKKKYEAYDSLSDKGSTL